jgi:hypothetical protein
MHIDVENGNPELKTLARSYARRVNGSIKSMKFDSKNGDFEVTFVTGMVGEESEIFASDEFYYDKGKVVEVGGEEGGAEARVEGDFVRVKNLVEGVEVTVKVSNKE